MNKKIEELTKEWVLKKLPFRSKDANKGTFGSVLVFAGSENYPGAAYLACAACYRVGAGLVTLATTKIVQQIVSKELPEVTFVVLPAEISFKGIDVCLIGPGLGQSKQTEKLVEHILKMDLPLVIVDADGLNLLSKIGKWQDYFKKEAIFTPHPGEMSRLTGLSIDEIQTDRINVAQYFAKKWDKVIVLKGANTVIAPPIGGVRISPFANPALATAGTGDVLSGVISGLVAQGLNLFDASCVGVYIHGFAGEMLRKKIGSTGALASDLLPLLPQAIQDLVNKTEHRVS